ncbi:MAG: phosphatase PAP2 family protein [Bacteroidota bacterium]
MLGQLPPLLNRLIEYDHFLFRLINQEWISGWMDTSALWVREPIHWAPLYALILLIAIWKFRTRGLIWFFFGVAAVVFSDLIGNYGFKHVFERLRPCNDPTIQTGLRLLVDKCGTGFSFVSNHSANHMCLATFIWITLPKSIRHWGWMGLAWALCIGYAQVYVGLHFPADIIAGAVLGALIGATVGASFNRQFKNSIFPVHQPNA